MLLVLKVTSVAFCYKDGELSEKEAKEVLFDHQLEKRLRKLSSYFEFQSYCYPIFGCLLGPYFDYKEFDEFIN